MLSIRWPKSVALSAIAIYFLTIFGSILQMIFADIPMSHGLRTVGVVAIAPVTLTATLFTACVVFLLAAIAVLFVLAIILRPLDYLLEHSSDAADNEFAFSGFLFGLGVFIIAITPGGASLLIFRKPVHSIVDVLFNAVIATLGCWYIFNYFS